MDPVQVEQIALGQIDPGERLLWSGAPAAGSAAVGALPGTLIGIPFFGFACFWIWSAYDAMASTSRSGPWTFFPLFGVPFALVGLGVMAAPLWAFLAARHTVYAVTERRALIIGGLFSRNVQSFTRAEIGNVTRIERPDGSGTVHFASRTYTTSKGFTRVRPIGFVGIPEVRRVEQLIRDHLQERAA